MKKSELIGIIVSIEKQIKQLRVHMTETPAGVIKGAVKNEEELNEYISDLPLPLVVKDLLYQRAIETTEKLSEYTFETILSIPGMGYKETMKLESILKRQGLRFRKSIT
jgi:DNA-directed RNA polymerase alpha subunit